MSASTSTTLFQLRQPIWVSYSSAAAAISSITIVELLVVRGVALPSLSLSLDLFISSATAMTAPAIASCIVAFFSSFSQLRRQRTATTPPLSSLFLFSFFFSLFFLKNINIIFYFFFNFGCYFRSEVAVDDC
ncbi:uncharacterized protein DS421_12g358490 [Arachis hypogaea]|nr:uncharacterized protein DS421_12g358490 [Arachis hypogaea]